MDTQEIETKVLEALKKVQELSGKPWTELKHDSKPIGDLAGFDSLTAIEATILIEEKLGCKIGQDTFFVSDNGIHALTIKQICDHLAGMLGPDVEKKQ